MTKKNGKKPNGNAAGQDSPVQTKEDESSKTAAESPESIDTSSEQTASVDKQEQPAQLSDAEKYAALEAKCRELQDQYLRKAADFDNYRKRMIKEKQEAIHYANSNLLTDLLQIIDDFDRAIEAGSKPENADSAFLQGVTMIQSSLTSLLESKYGLAYYPAQDQPFDPAIHEAVATTPSKDIQEPTVGAELQKGYKLKERVLRPAKVMVLMPQQDTQEIEAQTNTEN